MIFNKAVSLLELILVIFISSIIFIYSSIFMKQSYETQTKNQELAVLKLDLNSSKIIIERNLPNSYSKLSYKNKILYLDGSVLLKDVYTFKKSKSKNIINISINLKNKIKQNWSFKINE